MRRTNCDPPCAGPSHHWLAATSNLGQHSPGKTLPRLRSREPGRFGSSRSPTFPPPCLPGQFMMYFGLPFGCTKGSGFERPTSEKSAHTEGAQVYQVRHAAEISSISLAVGGFFALESRFSTFLVGRKNWIMLEM